MSELVSFYNFKQHMAHVSAITLIVM